MDYYEALQWIAGKIEMGRCAFLLESPENIEKAIKDVKTLVEDTGFKPLELRYSDYDRASIQELFGNNKDSEWVMVVNLDEPLSSPGQFFLRKMGNDVNRNHYGGIFLPDGTHFPCEVTIRSVIVITSQSVISKCKEQFSELCEYYAVFEI